MSDPSSLIGATMVLTLDGQKVTGKVVEAHEDRLLVRVAIHQPAKGYQGVIGKAIMPDGAVIKFDLGRQAHYSEILVEVPLPTADEAPAPAPEQERRKFFRLGIELPVEVVENVGFSKEYVRTRGETVNISGGGMLVDFHQPILPGVYKFRVHMPGEVLTLAGRVIRKPHSTSSVSPVEWVDIHEVERSKLIRLIFNRMRNLKDPGAEPGAEGAVAPKPSKGGEDEPRYWRRREKFYKPGKIRYW